MSLTHHKASRRSIFTLVYIFYKINEFLRCIVNRFSSSNVKCIWEKIKQLHSFSALAQGAHMKSILYTNSHVGN